MATSVSSKPPAGEDAGRSGSGAAAARGGTLRRYARLLDALGEAPGGLSFTELMHRSALPRGTVHRLLGALAEVGYVELDAGRRLYTLGPRLLRLLHAGTPEEMLEARAQEALAALVERFEETAFLARLRGERVETVAMAMPPSEQRSYVQPGRLMPLHAAASAKAIFAWQQPALVERLLRKRPTRYTEHTLVERAAIRAELARVRETGYAVCADELDHGVYSYACPLRVEGAGVLYSIGLVGLTPRMLRYAPEEIVAALHSAAARLAATLSNGTHPAPRR